VTGGVYVMVVDGVGCDLSLQSSLYLAIFLWLFLILEQNVISFAGSKEITKENSFPAARNLLKIIVSR
jgi:hypothetical protein